MCLAENLKFLFLNLGCEDVVLWELSVSKGGAMNENATKKGDFCVEARLSIGLGIVD